MSAPPTSPETLTLADGHAVATLPLGYGPRIASFAPAGGVSVLADAPDAGRDTPRGRWRAYGGHRLWVAPERFPATYTLDDAAPRVLHASARRAVLAQDAQDDAIAKTLDVTLADGTLTVRHVLRNEGPSVRRVAPWAITIVRPGGTALIPNPPYAPQPEALLPARPFAMWKYSDWGDPRFRFGGAYTQLRSDPQLSAPQKIGAGCEAGWVGYVLDDMMFVKRAPFDPAATYPDFGCSVEVYVEGAFCEIETLGPLVDLAPGAESEHVETWSFEPIAP